MLVDMPASTAHATGLLLAAGAGRRMGRPKALVRDLDGTSWLVRSVSTLLDGGCREVLVVLGAEADAAIELLPPHDPRMRTVYADRWADGMGTSLRVGLEELMRTPPTAGATSTDDGTGDDLPDAAVISLVDLSDVGPAVVRRVLATAASDRPDPSAVLARAAYSGVPGHPVVLGRAHWRAVAESAEGDAGARTYLSARDVLLVECGDLARGLDQDTPPA